MAAEISLRGHRIVLGCLLHIFAFFLTFFLQYDKNVVKFTERLTYVEIGDII